MKETNMIFEKNKVAIAILALLLVSSSFVMLGNSAVVKPSLTATPLSTPTTNYGDIMQYPWPQAGYDEGFSCSNPGPGPDRPNVLWKIAPPGSSVVSVFAGKAFVASGTTVYVL